MLPLSGVLGLDDLQREFGGEYPTTLAEYIAGGKYVRLGTLNGAGEPIPDKLPLSLSHFYGARRTDPGEIVQTIPGIYEFVVPFYAKLTITVFGGGGSSGSTVWDGPAEGDDPGDVGFTGDASYVGGVVIPGQRQTYGGRYRVLLRNDPHTATDFLIRADGGGGGAAGPNSTVSGADAGGVVSAAISDASVTTTITVGGGGKGGPSTPYLGYISTAMGGPGGAGGAVVVEFDREDVGAPKPGDRLAYIVGRGGDGLKPGNIGPGSNGMVKFVYT